MKKIINIVSIVLLLIANIANIYGLTLNSNYQLYVNLIAIMFEAFYIAYGCSKNASLFFRAFMAFVGLKEALALINMAMYETVPASAIALVLVCYTFAVILAVSKDLGKKVSFTLGFVILAISIVCLFFAISLTPPTFLGGGADGTYLFIYNSTRVLLSLELVVMIMAKYNDKALRNTK